MILHKYLHQFMICTYIFFSYVISLFNLKLPQVGLELPRLLTTRHKFVCFVVTSSVHIECARSSLCQAHYLSRESIGTEFRESWVRVPLESTTLNIIYIYLIWTHDHWIPFRGSNRLRCQAMNSTLTQSQLYTATPISFFVHLFIVLVTFSPLPSSVATFALSKISHLSAYIYIYKNIYIHTYIYIYIYL